MKERRFSVMKKEKKQCGGEKKKCEKSVREKTGVDMNDGEYLERMRHTLSHILALAVQSVYSGTGKGSDGKKSKDGVHVKFGVGPAIENGFYYDLDLGEQKISEEDLTKIEKKMRGIVARKLPVVRSERTRSEALAWAEENDQPYKKELIEDLPTGEDITFYTIGEFEDLCKGPHLENTGEVGAFKLTKVAGAYWRGDEKREMLTRVYGVAFATEEELEEYLKKQEEAKARDHRKLGRELDLYCNSPLVGSGLPLFTPRGTVLRDKLNEFTQGYRLRCGYKKVCIPHIANIDLYKTSGHYEKFPEMLQFVSQESGDHLALKPVSCPHHSQIFASLPRSYKELPVKYLETTMVYRDERKGELGGLSRVRAITQDDSHVFCTEEQVGEIFGELIEAAKDLYERVGMGLKLRLSFRDDGDGYIGTPEMWAKAEKSIQEMADKFQMDYYVGVGEAAMYGPKMDFMATDALGREWQLATVQLDYALPERFKLEYTDAEGRKQRPIMIHCALIGSIERFMSVFIEHTVGWFPLWCAPEQVRVLTVNAGACDYARKVCEVLSGVVLEEPIKGNELRFECDFSDESLGKKIRRATEMKIPVMLIVGERDAEAGTVSVRTREGEETVELAELAEWLKSQ